MASAADVVKATVVDVGAVRPKQPFTWYGVGPDASSDYIAGLRGHIAILESQLVALRERAVRVGEEVAAWSRFFATPKVETATKDAYIKPHLDHWQAEAAKVRDEMGRLERDIANLRLIVDAHLGQ